VPAQPRLPVLTDLGGDPDDQQSLIRLMTCADVFDGKVRPNLLLDRPDYPPAAALLGRVKSGNPRRGVKDLGAGYDTEGSRSCRMLRTGAATGRNRSRPSGTRA
jgi:hypothetical protein